MSSSAPSGQAPDASGGSEPPRGHVARESALEPELPICDPHHHLWTHRGRYLVDELLHDMGCGHRIVSTVCVTSHAMMRGAGPEELRPVGETDFIEALVAKRRADDEPDVARGIVAYANLTLGAAVLPVLQAHRDASPRRFCGVRHTATWDPDLAIRNPSPHPRAGLLLERDFQAGADALASMGLVFDAFVFHPQLPDLRAFARALPGLTIVLNHAGMPLGTHAYAASRDAVMLAWQRDMALLADCPNVVVKVGGFGMQRFGLNWEGHAAPVRSGDVAAVIAPYVDVCIGLFGADRCMFESNFPVDKEGLGYDVLWNAFKRASVHRTTQERSALFHDTATRVYRLAERRDAAQA